VINIHQIVKKYESTIALDSVSFQVDDGELFGVIGPDGAGKTSLFRIITSLLLPDSGAVRVNGFDVIKDYHQIRKITGYMPGRFSLYHDLTVEENLQFYATVFGTDVKTNYDLIKDIYSHIEPFKNRLAGQLSGGMKQKLALSCALIHRPQILVLDEPTTGVDAVSRKEFWEMLKKIQKEGIIVLVSTPYMDEALLCDRVVFMDKAKVLAMDSPQGLIQAYSRDLISISSDEMHRLVMDLRKYPDVNSALLFGHEVHYTSRSGRINESELIRYLEKEEHKNIKLKIIEPGIEDRFLELIS
jgi:ABC-type multidrug transport system ATPase subunit